VACVSVHDRALAQAQLRTIQAGCQGDGTACQDTVIVAANGDIQLVTNQPYKARAVTEIDQTLADGSHMNQTATGMIARDSDGRTVHTQQLRNGTTTTIVFDPVARTHTAYTSDTKIAHVMTLPTTLPSGATLAVGSGYSSAAGPVVSAGFVLQGHAGPSLMSDKANTKTESLGTKAIDGVQVAGTRSTSTIPAGTIGNDKDIITTRETWYSAQLKLDVLKIQDDPRFGHTTYSLTNIQLGEPEAALFQVPPDYKVETRAMPQPPS
jgi:hypothetical protein